MRRSIRWIVLVAVILTVGALGAYALLNARGHAQRALAALNYVKTHVLSATSGAARNQLVKQLDVAAQQSALAEGSLYSTVVLRPISWIPYFGNEISGAHMLFADARHASLLGVSLLESLNSFDAANQHGLITSRNVGALAKAIDTANTEMKRLNRPVGSLFSVVGHDRSTFNHEVSKVVRALTTAQSGIQVAQSLLGTAKPTTILVLAQNNAEMREQGAFLSYSLLRAQNGSFTSLRAGSTWTINPPAPVSVPSTYGLRRFFYVDRANQIFQSVNATADFPWTGATAAAMFKADTGITVDDVVALDVPTVAQLLGVTGPVRVPGVPIALSSSNIATYLLHDLYAQYPVGSQIPRKDDLNDIATALLQRINTNRREDLSLLRALAGQLPGRHLMLWSAQPSVESAITKLGASGAVDTVLPKRTFHVAVESDVAAKLDYYVTVNEHYDVQLLAAGGALVTTTVVVHNGAPANQPPSYQLGPDHINSFRPGDYVANVYLWSPRGSLVYGGSPESGLVLSANLAQAAPQQSSSSEFSAYLPSAVEGGRFVLHLVPQPRLTPETVSVYVHGSSWRVQRPRVMTFALTTSTTLRFNVSPTP